MINISSLGKVTGVTLNTWFVPTMFAALELDNSFVLWSSVESEYYIDTVNNLLKVKQFNRVRRSFSLNIITRDGKVLLVRNSIGDYYPSREKPFGFRLPIIGDSLIMNEIPYVINNIILTSGNIELQIEDQADFINNFNSQVIFIDGTNSDPLYTDSNGVYYSKNYRSANIADIYIDGADIRSIVGRYL